MSKAQAKGNKANFKAGLVDNYFYIRKILKKKKLKDGRVKLFVSWQGWPESYNSWVYQETVTPLDQFLKNVQSGSFESSMNSSRFASKCSDKKEKLEDSAIHQQSVPKKATTPKYKKLKKPKRQYEIDDDSEINLLPNLKNNNDESDKVIESQSLNCTTGNINQISNVSQLENRQKIDCQHQDVKKKKVRKERKKSKLSIKSYKKSKQAKLDEESLSMIKRQNENNQSQYKISLEQLSSSKGEISKISSVSEITCFKKFPPILAKPKAVKVVGLNKPEQVINEGKPTEKITEFESSRQLVPINMQILNEAKQNQPTKQNNQNWGRWIENNEDQNLLPDSSQLEKAIYNQQQRPVQQTGTNLLSNLDISFGKDQTSMLLFGLADGKKDQSRDNEINACKLDSTNFLSQSLHENNQKDISKPQQANQHPIPAKIEQIVQEVTQNQLVSDYQSPPNLELNDEKLKYEQTSAINTSSNQSQSDLKSESQLSETSQTKDRQSEMRFKKYYQDIFKASLRQNQKISAEKLEEQCESPHFCQIGQETHKNSRRSQAIKKQQTQSSQFESYLNKSLLFPEDSVLIGGRSKQEQQRVVKNTNEQQESAGRSSNSRSATTILFWESNFNSNSDSSHREKLRTKNNSKKSRSKEHYNTKDRS